MDTEAIMVLTIHTLYTILPAKQETSIMPNLVINKSRILTQVKTGNVHTVQIQSCRIVGLESEGFEFDGIILLPIVLR
jgi:hypothetical protein